MRRQEQKNPKRKHNEKYDKAELELQKQIFASFNKYKKGQSQHS